MSRQTQGNSSHYPEVLSILLECYFRNGPRPDDGRRNRGRAWVCQQDILNKGWPTKPKKRGRRFDGWNQRRQKMTPQGSQKLLRIHRDKLQMWYQGPCQLDMSYQIESLLRDNTKWNSKRWGNGGKRWYDRGRTVDQIIPMTWHHTAGWENQQPRQSK